MSSGSEYESEYASDDDESSAGDDEALEPSPITHQNRPRTHTRPGRASRPISEINTSKDASVKKKKKRKKANQGGIERDNEAIAEDAELEAEAAGSKDFLDVFEANRKLVNSEKKCNEISAALEAELSHAARSISISRTVYETLDGTVSIAEAELSPMQVPANEHELSEGIMELRQLLEQQGRIEEACDRDGLSYDDILCSPEDQLDRLIQSSPVPASMAPVHMVHIFQGGVLPTTVKYTIRYYPHLLPDENIFLPDDIWILKMTNEITRSSEQLWTLHGLPSHHRGTLLDAYKAFPYKTHGGITYTFSSFKHRYVTLQRMQRDKKIKGIEVIQREVVNSKRVALIHARQKAARKYRAVIQADLNEKLPSLLALCGSERNLQRLNSIIMYDSAITKADMHLATRSVSDATSGIEVQRTFKTSVRRTRTTGPYGIRGLRLYSKREKQNQESKSYYRTGNIFFSDPSRQDNKTVLGVFPSFPSELRSVLEDRASKGECATLRFEESQQQRTGPTQAHQTTDAMNASIVRIVEVYGQAEYDASTGIAIVEAAVEQATPGAHDVGTQLHVILEICLLGLHSFIDGYTPSRQFHRTAAVYRLIDTHRHLLPVKGYAGGIYGMDYLRGDKRLGDDLYIRAADDEDNTFVRKTVFRALVDQINDVERTVLVVTDQYIPELGGISPIPSVGSDSIPRFRAFGWHWMFISGDEGLLVGLLGLLGGHGTVSRPSAFSHAQYAHFPTVISDPDNPDSELLELVSASDYLKLFRKQRRLTRAVMQIIKECLEQPGGEASAPLDGVRDDPMLEEARNLLLSLTTTSSSDCKPIRSVLNGTSRSTAENMGIGMLEAIRLLCVRYCFDVARVPLPYANHPHLEDFLSSDTDEVPVLSWWRKLIPQLPDIVIPGRSLHCPWKMGNLILTLVYENAMLWLAGEVVGNNSTSANARAIAHLDDIMAASTVGKRFMNNADLWMGRQVAEATHVLRTSPQALAFLPFPARMCLHLSDIHIWLNKMTSFSSLPLHLRQFPEVLYKIIPLLLSAVAVALDGGEDRTKNGYFQEAIQAEGILVERIGLPPFVVGEDGGEADLQISSKVLSTGRPGSQALLQETNLFDAVHERRRANMYLAPSQQSRNVGLLADDVAQARDSLENYIVNLAVCTCFGPDACPKLQRMANNITARLTQMQRQYPSLGIAKKDSHVDSAPAPGAPEGCWLLPLSGSPEKPWLMVCGCRKNMKSRSYSAPDPNDRNTESEMEMEATLPNYASAATSTVMDIANMVKSGLAVDKPLAMVLQLNGKDGTPADRFLVTPSADAVHHSRTPGSHARPASALQVQITTGNGRWMTPADIKFSCDALPASGRVHVTMTPPLTPGRHQVRVILLCDGETQCAETLQGTPFDLNCVAGSPCPRQSSIRAKYNMFGGNPESSYSSSRRVMLVAGETVTLEAILKDKHGNITVPAVNRNLQVQHSAPENMAASSSDVVICQDNKWRIRQAANGAWLFESEITRAGSHHLRLKHEGNLCGSSLGTAGVIVKVRPGPPDTSQCFGDFMSLVPLSLSQPALFSFKIRDRHGNDLTANIDDGDMDFSITIRGTRGIDCEMLPQPRHTARVSVNPERYLSDPCTKGRAITIYWHQQYKIAGDGLGEDTVTALVYPITQVTITSDEKEMYKSLVLRLAQKVRADNRNDIQRWEAMRREIGEVMQEEQKTSLRAKVKKLKQVIDYRQQKRTYYEKEFAIFVGRKA